VRKKLNLRESETVSLVLEVKAGRLAGKRIAVPDGGEVTIGRAPNRANFGVPHDNFMSSVHFAVACGPEGSRVKDRGSSNGTFLNGARITESPLSDGDEIRSGRTIFVVRVVAGVQPSPAPAEPVAPPPAAPAATKPAPPAPPVEPSPLVEAPAPAPTPSRPAPVAPPPPPPPEPVAKPVATEPAAPPAPEPPVVAAPPAPPRPAAAKAPPEQQGPSLITIGSWRFAKVPEGWEAQGEFGVQRAEKDAFPSNVVATEEMLGLATLQRFVEAQVAMLRQYLREPQIEAALPPSIPGADETVALDIRYATKDDQVIFMRRIYASHAKQVGVLTLTTLEKDLEEIRPALDAILAGACFQPQE
jgi:pSer/pThr/pTyr-binding forkhead associated (FHA) protein